MRQVDRIMEDPALAAETVRRMPALRRRYERRAIVVPPGETTREDRELSVSPAPRRMPTEGLEEPQVALRAPVRTAGDEAIIKEFGRPSLLIRDDTFEVPPSDTWKGRLYPSKARIDRVLRSVGRVEVAGLTIPYAGTAWMIAPGVAVTNRHVAVTFAQRLGPRSFSFRKTPIGRQFVAKVDFREEAGRSTPFEVDVTEVLYLSESTDEAPDFALVRVKARDDTPPLPPPIPLFDGDLALKQVVVTIGYPAQDDRNSFANQARIFEGLFNVKRLAPGEIIGFHDRDLISHDCTTLGGSSGSVVLDVASGEAVGLHFAGVEGEANYALSVAGLRAALKASRTQVNIARRKAVPPRASVAADEATVDPASLAGREGYDEEFLGSGRLRTPLPSLTSDLAEVTLVVNTGGTGLARHLLKYEHFSLTMHAQRRLAIFTAVNIDGAQSVRRKRERDVWMRDPRIPAAAQIGNELYRDNDLDRGHLVRRLDPTWGKTAERAEIDTFFFTNASPQHATFNQTFWAELEDYLLDSADTLGFRATVFTGPIFEEADPKYRDAALPGSFWKVAVMQRAKGKKLSATGYIVSQADLLTKLEFVYGQFKTYQVSLAHIEGKTGLDFGTLKRADPLGKIEALAPRELVRPADITI